MTRRDLTYLIAGLVLMYGIQNFNRAEAEPVKRTVFIHTEQDVCGYDDIGLLRLTEEMIEEKIR